MSQATVFVDDAVLGRLPPICIKDGVPDHGHAGGGDPGQGPRRPRHRLAPGAGRTARMAGADRDRGRATHAPACSRSGSLSPRPPTGGSGGPRRSCGPSLSPPRSFSSPACSLSAITLGFSPACWPSPRCSPPLGGRSPSYPHTSVHGADRSRRVAALGHRSAASTPGSPRVAGAGRSLRPSTSRGTTASPDRWVAPPGSDDDGGNPGPQNPGRPVDRLRACCTPSC